MNYYVFPNGSLVDLVDPWMVDIVRVNCMITY